MAYSILIKVRDLFRIRSEGESLNYERGGKDVIGLFEKEYKATMHYNLHFIIHERDVEIDHLKTQVAYYKQRYEEELEHAKKKVVKQVLVGEGQTMRLMKQSMKEYRIKLRLSIHRIILGDIPDYVKIGKLKAMVKSWNIDEPELEEETASSLSSPPKDLVLSQDIVDYFNLRR